MAEKQVLEMPYEVGILADQPGEPISVSIDGSIHTFDVKGNLMHETWMPASYLMEFDWIRIPVQTTTGNMVPSEYNDRLCEIVTFDRNGMTGFGVAAPISQRSSLIAKLPGLRKKYPSKKFDVRCEEGD